MKNIFSQAKNLEEAKKQIHYGWGTALVALVLTVIAYSIVLVMRSATDLLPDIQFTWWALVDIVLILGLGLGLKLLKSRISAILLCCWINCWYFGCVLISKIDQARTSN